MSAFAFYLFAISAIAGGLLTVMSRNPVHSVLWLILAFFNAASSPMDGLLPAELAKHAMAEGTRAVAKASA